MELRRWLRLWGGCSLLALCGAVPEAGAHGDLHVRIEALAAEIKKQPQDAQLYLQRGELHRMHEDWALAEADYAQAEKLSPGLAAVRLGRSQLLLAQKQFTAARKEVDRFLADHPGHVAALIVRAQSLAGEKQFLAAAEAWEQVIAKTPKPDVEHYYQRAQALTAAGPKHTDAALKTLDAGVAKVGNVPSLGLFAVQLEVGRKQYDAALERLDRAMPKTGRKETWRELRGDILASAERKAEAQEEYAKALEELKASPARARSTKAGAELEARLRAKARP